MRGSVLADEVVRIVRCDERQIEFARELDETGVHGVLLGNAVAHDLDVKAVAEDLMERRRGFLRTLVVVAQQWLRAQARHAAGEHDQSAVVLLEQFHIDARLVVVALEKAFRDERNEVPVTLDVAGQKRDVRFFAHAAVVAASRRDVGFATDDRHERMLARGVVELHRSEHDAVVGQGYPRRTLFRGPLAKRIDATRSVQKRVFAMNVEMNERTQVARVWGCGPGYLRLGDRLPGAASVECALRVTHLRQCRSSTLPSLGFRAGQPNS